MELFGGEGARALADALEAEGALRRRRDGLRPGSGRSQADQVDIRNAGGSPVTIVAADSGQVIGTVDRARALAGGPPNSSRSASVRGASKAAQSRCGAST